ncbi:MAG: COX15/CtaA family protein [Pseudomonadota bacterium]
MSSTQELKNSRAIAAWLFGVAGLVLAMAVIGAITRLTESGLSMVEWRPLIGTIPPLTTEEWQRVFDLYRETPEYNLKNAGMDLEEFKFIFFWEWFHRFWGRLIGLAYALPLIYFWVRNKIPQGYKAKLLFGLFLGGSQAIMGWYMVESGLVDRPDVSHFRLAAHLSLAFVIFSYLLWLGFDLNQTPRKNVSKKIKIYGLVSLGLVAITIIWGAYVAGLNGGLVYNTWPKMGPHWIPPEVTSLISLKTDPVAVQYTHRWIAVITMAIVLFFAYKIKSFAIAGVMIFQVGLGIATLLTQVDITLAALHQFNAFILIGFMIYHLYVLRVFNISR